MYPSLVPEAKTENTFKCYAEKLVQLLETEGITKHAYSDPTLPVFNSLSEDQKQAANYQLQFYVESLETLANAGELLSNNATSLWSAFRKLNMKPPSDLFSQLNDDDCIELYDANHIQIWRNINMMKIMSHTIEQVFCVPWPNRYHRDEQAMKECVSIVLNILSEKIIKVHHVDVKNFVFEKDSSELLKLDVVHRYIAPVTDDTHNISGYLVGSLVNVIGSGKKTSSPGQPEKNLEII